MNEFFNPKTVAVIGVSSSPDNLACNILANLIEFNFKGTVYEVGIRGGVCFGRKIYRSVTNISDHIDLAVILTPARTISGILRDCGKKGIKHVIIESAGFGEYGQEGQKLDKELLDIAKKYGIKFIGPNCIGAMNLHNGLALSFTAFKNVFRKGSVSIVTQSGGVGISYLNLLSSENIGLGKFASIGNKLNINENDILEYLIHDPETEIICLYLESISDGRRLMDIALRSSKPILLHKANIGREAMDIAQSHTASLSSDDAVVSAALKQAGIARFKDPETMLNYLKILPLAKVRGNQLAIISRSGGHAVIAADACGEAGFTLSEFDKSFIKEIEKHFRANVIRLTNPLDLGDLFDYKVYSKIIKRTIAQKNVHGVVFLHTYISSTEGELSRKLFAELEKISFKYKKPIAICVATDEEELYKLRQELSRPVFVSPSGAIHALALSRDFHHGRKRGRVVAHKYQVNKKAVRSVINACKTKGINPSIKESMDILEDYGIKVIQGSFVKTEKEAILVAKKIGYPVVMKVVCPSAIHKTEIGGVKLDIKDQGELVKNFQKMQFVMKKSFPKSGNRGVLIQPMMKDGVELIIGAKRDPNFGPTIMVGLGGIFVEVFKDTSLRIIPFSDDELNSMFPELKGYQILAGTRGQKGYDLNAAKNTVKRLCMLVTDFPEISEIDLNPFKILPKKGAGFCLDARIIL